MLLFASDVHGPRSSVAFCTLKEQTTNTHTHTSPPTHTRPDAESYAKIKQAAQQTLPVCVRVEVCTPDASVCACILCVLCVCECVSKPCTKLRVIKHIIYVYMRVLGTRLARPHILYGLEPNAVCSQHAETCWRALIML